jgi:glycosyltransferase involved in cell wall biosynthesis
MIYLNVGHTGLNQTGLVRWISRNQINAVYLIHDLIPITHPQFCRPGEQAKHEVRIENALASAAGIICNSEATRSSLGDFARAKGLALPESIVSWISGPPVASHGAPKVLDRPYFVTLGTIEARKNHLLLLKVWQDLVLKFASSAPLLVIIGQRGWKAEKATAILDDPQELEEHIYELGCCNDEDLASWLAGARALLMPSLVEGFGLPVIEALRLGVPVITSDLPVYREIVGSIPTYLDPSDAAAWQGTIADFMADGAERSRQLGELRHFEAPDWSRHFADIEDWLHRVEYSLATAGE